MATVEIEDIPVEVCAVLLARAHARGLTVEALVREMLVREAAACAPADPPDTDPA